MSPTPLGHAAQFRASVPRHALEPAGVLPRWLTSHLVAQGPALWPRFVERYATLQTLPRRVRRALCRQWRQSLAGLALLLALDAGPVPAATIPVGGACTLVAAIHAANRDQAVGGCPAGSGADTIVLPPGSTQSLAVVDNTVYGATGLPVITSTMTIAGQGSTILRDAGAPVFRIMAVESAGTLTLQETTVSGGRAEDGDHAFGLFGGGIFNAEGTVTLIHSTLSGNTAGGSGGGIHNDNGTVTVTHSTLSGNTTVGPGGGSSGGGIHNDNGTVTVTHSTLSGNTAAGFRGGGIGGGIHNDNGTVTVTHSTLSGNTAAGFFGGGSGGGIHNGSGTVTVTHSTLSGNTAVNYGGGSGGGIHNGSGTVTLARTLVTGNTASASEIFNAGTVYADNFNLFGFNGDAGVSGFAPGPTDVVPGPGVLLADILDPTLADNGGPTLTHALVSESPAVDAIPPARCPPPAMDQRGFDRPADGDGDGIATCDIGAVEFLAGPLGEPGDLDGDGDVDRQDLTLLLRDRNKRVSVSACGLPCDLDGDAVITALDARRLVALCTRPRCATH